MQKYVKSNTTLTQGSNRDQDVDNFNRCKSMDLLLMLFAFTLLVGLKQAPRVW